jgi:phage shock protein PspC (stress-responsive transcriptional regulator)
VRHRSRTPRPPSIVVRGTPELPLEHRSSGIRSAPGTVIVDVSPTVERKTVLIMASSLVRPSNDRWIGGVCAGLARRFGISANTMRLIFVISCLLPGPQFLIYIALWFLVPNEH